MDTAEQMLRENAALVAPAGGVLHLMAKRGDVRAVKWRQRGVMRSSKETI